MKNIAFLKNPLFWLLAIIGLSVGVAFRQYEPNAAAQAVYKSWSQDTITNGENDTLTIPQIIESPYQYAVQIRFTNLSGTQAGKVYLEQVLTSSTASTDWIKCDSATLSASVPTYLIKGANTWGTKYRVIIDGSGTQSTHYRAKALFKRTN